MGVIKVFKYCATLLTADVHTCTYVCICEVFTRYKLKKRKYKKIF